MSQCVFITSYVLLRVSQFVCQQYVKWRFKILKFVCKILKKEIFAVFTQCYLLRIFLIIVPLWWTDNNVSIVIIVGLFIREHDYCICGGGGKNSLIMCAIIPTIRGLQLNMHSVIYIWYFLWLFFVFPCAATISRICYYTRVSRYKYLICSAWNDMLKILKIWLFFFIDNVLFCKIWQ